MTTKSIWPLALIIIGILLWSSCQTKHEQWNPSQYKRIDVHTHFYADRPFIIPILEAMNIERSGILQAVGMVDTAFRLEYEQRILAVRD